MHGKSPSGLSLCLFYQEILKAVSTAAEWLFYYNDDSLHSRDYNAKSAKYVANF